MSKDFVKKNRMKTKHKTRKNKNVNIPPAVAEGAINLVEFLVEVGGKRRTRRRKKSRKL
jgi:hypothetical protein